MRTTILIALLALTACAPGPKYQARDVTGQDRSKAEFQHDSAACEYEMARARAGAGYLPGADPLTAAVIQGPGDEFYYTCLRARGWSLTEIQ